MSAAAGQRIHGVIPVLEVPFTVDEDVDLEGFETVVRNTVRAGAHGVMFPAFASEFTKLAADERRELEDLLLALTLDREVVTVLAVQQASTRLAVRAAESATARGATAINLLPPAAAAGLTAVENHVARVARAIAPVEVVVQYAPAEAGRSLDAEAVGRLAEQHANLWGIKLDASPAAPVMQSMRSVSERIGRPIGITIGYAGLHLLDGVARGATAVQPGCSFTELYVRLWRLLDQRRTRDAAELHRRMLPYLAHWMQSVDLIVAAEKLISQRRGWFRHATVRQPGYLLDALEIERVDRFLSEFDAELQPG